MEKRLMKRGKKKKKEGKISNWEKPSSDVILENLIQNIEPTAEEIAIKMEHEALQATIEIINDAIKIYSNKLSAKHKKIFTLEEVISSLLSSLSSSLSKQHFH